MTRRDLTRFADPVHEYRDLAEFLSASVPAGVLTVDYHGAPLDILNRSRGAATTVVVFHTALSPQMTTVPVFSGLEITAGLDTNLVCVSDPSLSRDDTLKLAWFAGNQDQPLQRDLPTILRHILASQGAEHVVFFGASGGGFAALYYSHFFPGSLALPMNPQIIVKDYDDDAALAYATACFGAATLEQARAVLADRVTGDVRHLYRGGFTNTVGYVQNLMDTHHLYRQLAHFLGAVPTSPRMNLLVEDWGRGHIPPPRELTRTVLRSVVDAEGDWTGALARLGFESAPAPSWPVDSARGPG